MALEFKLPELGENIESGKVTKVLVAVGDQVREDQPVVELETDKATLDVPAPAGGTVAEIRAKEGESLKVGQVLLILDTGGAAAGKASEPSEPPAQAPPKPAAVAPPEPPAPAKPAPKPASPAESPAGKKDSPQQPTAAQARKPGAPTPAAPSVRRLARELGVDIGTVPGSGPGGRITAEDVRDFAAKTEASEQEKPSADDTASTDLATDSTGVERQKMSAIRRITAERMAAAWATIPHVTQFDKADITAFEAFRKRYGPKAEKQGGKLTVTALILKLLGDVLKEFPQFNASVDMETQTIELKRGRHIGVAVDTPHGLLVPVVRDVDRKGLIALAVEIGELAEKARNKKIVPQELQGGTFTVTNLGGIGGTAFTPIVNAPQVAILGISRGQIEPVYRDGRFEPRTMLPLALSYDHRAIDGADGARFLRRLVEAIEEPYLLLVE